MPQHSNCCVPGCLNNFRNAPHLQYYRIPKDKKLRKTYKIILRNETLKIESSATRICSSHFEGGTKLSRSHLPSIFPWTTEKCQRRELKRLPVDQALDIGIKRRKQTTQQLSTSTEVNVEESDQSDCKDTTTQTTLKLTDLINRENTEKELLSKVKDLEEQLRKLKEDHSVLNHENAVLKKEVSRLKYELNNQKFDIVKYKDRKEDIAFYTGFPDYGAFILCYDLIKDSAKNLNYSMVEKDGHVKDGTGRPRALGTFEEFTIVMMRLRLGLFERDLSHRFGIHVSTVSRLVKIWIRFLRCEFGPLIDIPSSAIIRHYMPPVFKNIYPKLTVIVDCTEVEMEKPSSLDAQSACYSSYKSRTTMKSLIGITPSGVVCFVSEFFPGSISDKEITVKSGFLNKLKQGDQVLADKGFNCQDELASVGATLIIPAFLKGTNQFSQEQTEHNKKVATLRIHVERFMERIKNWHIFDHKIPVTLTPVASDILIVVSAISNFQPPLIN